MPVDRQWQLPRTEYAQPKVSAVITTRNEHPVLFVSIFAILEELEFWGYPFEFVIVSNCDTDLTPRDPGASLPALAQNRPNADRAV